MIYIQAKVVWLLQISQANQAKLFGEFIQVDGSLWTLNLKYLTNTGCSNHPNGNRTCASVQQAYEDLYVSAVAMSGQLSSFRKWICSEARSL